MLIKSYSNCIYIPEGEEFVIYTECYDADCYGNKLDSDDERVKSGQFYDYGDIIIQTANRKYIFTKVYNSYDWIPYINDEISRCIKENEPIIIDFDELKKDSDGGVDEFFSNFFIHDL